MYHTDWLGRKFETKEACMAFYEQADQIGRWEKQHRVPERKRLTWFYPDFGVYVPNDWVTPEEVAKKFEEITGKKPMGKSRAFAPARARERSTAGWTTVPAGFLHSRPQLCGQFML